MSQEPSREVARLSELAAYRIMDSGPDAAFDALAQAAALVAGTSVAAIGLVDHDREWFKAAVGLDIDEVAREVAFCDHVVRDRQPVIVDDATADPRFADNPLVVAEDGIRFYAGFPLTTPTGEVLGSLCVTDSEPHTLDPSAIRVLWTLADQAMAQIELRRQTTEAYAARDALAERNLLLAGVVDAIDVAILVCDAEGTMIIDNEVYRREAGVTTDELKAMDASERSARVYLRHPDGSPMQPEEWPLNRALREGHIEGIEVLIERDGQDRMTRVHGHSLRRPDGSLLGAMIAAVDITEDWERERELATRIGHVEKLAAASRAILTSPAAGQVACDAVLELSGALQVALAVPDGAGNLIFTAGTSPALQDLVIPLSEDSMAGRVFREHTLLRVDLGETTVYGDAAERITRFHGPPQGALYLPLLHDDACLGVLLLTTAGPITGLPQRTVDLIDILSGELSTALERDRLGSELASQATTDPLTGLANRRVWDQRLAAQARELGRVPTSMAILDLDHFKAYNDEFGHPAGDELLRMAAAAWAGALRGQDLLARIGGEEFGILLFGCSAVDAVMVLDKLRARVPYGESASIGLAEQRAGESPLEWAARADRALYRAKSEGRDRLVVDDGDFLDRRGVGMPEQATVRALHA